MSRIYFLTKPLIFSLFLILIGTQSLAQNFYQTYAGFDSYAGQDLQETANGYVFTTKKRNSSEFQILQLNYEGVLQNSASVNLPIEVTSHVPNGLHAIRLRTGGFVQAYILNGQNVPKQVFVLQHNSSGAITHSFEIDFPSDAGLFVKPRLLELSDGKVMIVSGYSPPNPIGPPGNKHLSFTEYNPTNQSVVQQNATFWDEFAIVTTLLGLEESSDGNLFLNIWNENNENRHYIAKYTKSGSEFFRTNTANLERPVTDMVASPDGGVWYWNSTFNSINKINSDQSNGGSVSVVGIQNEIQDEVIITGIAPRSNGGVLFIAKAGLKLLIARTSPNGSIDQYYLYDQYAATANSYGGVTSDGGFYFAGYTASFNSPPSLPVLVKTNSIGEIETPTTGDGDLKLTLSGSDTNPSIWQGHSITATVTNEGGIAMQNIVVNIPKPDGDVFVGGNEFTASQGSFNLYTAQTNWQVGTLSAGSSATISINYFKNSSAAFFQYAQIISHDGNDQDSTPGNGNGQSANEDDEAVYGGSGPSNPCGNDSVSPVISNCPNDISIVTADPFTLVSWDEPQISDQCSTASFTSVSHQPNSYFSQGQTTVTYRGIDQSGNEATCSFVVSVTGTINPPSGCVNNLLADPGFENGFNDFSWRNVDGNASITSDAFSGSSAMKIGGFSDHRIIQTLAVTAGSNYSLIANAKISDSNKRGVIYLKFMSSSYQPLLRATEEINSSSYQAWTLNAVAPSNAAFVEVGLQKSNGDFELFADDWCLNTGTIVTPTGKPDLRIDRLTGPAIVAPNSLMEYNLSIVNESFVQQNGDFTIRTYFSTNSFLSADDIQDGVIQTGNLGPAQTIDNVLGSSMVPNLPDGNYFLLVKIDADDEVEEENEINNIFIKEITIQNGTIGTSDYCEVSSEWPWHEWVSNIGINNQLDWSSEKSFYSDFTTATPVATIERGADASYTFDVTFSYLTSKSYFRYYVDFNQNGVFEENEGGSSTKNAIAQGTNVVATHNVSHSIPVYAKLGTTRARFIYSKDPITSACANIAFGEIEDYTVLIVDEQPNTREILADENLFFVYPNPVQYELTVDISQLNSVKEVSIYNLLGHLIFSQKTETDRYAKAIKINTNELLDGTYVLRVSGDDFKSRGELIVVQRGY